MNLPSNMVSGTGARSQRIEGCLIGAAVGDAIGLPYEGLSTRRARRWMKPPLRHRFVLGRGMVSDDTDHLVFVTQSLLLGNGDAAAFQRHLAWRLRWWLLCLPAGIGWATLRGIVRLWFGMARSGVMSAGNGPSMRSAVIGAMFPDDMDQRRRHVEASTALTHADPQALAGAMALAELTAHIVSGRWQGRPSGEALCDSLRAVSSHPRWLQAVDAIGAVIVDPSPMQRAMASFATSNGVSGYVMRSVPYAVSIWYLHHGDYRATVEAAVQAGGDVDTVAAMAGALAGATVGLRGIPADWVTGIVDRPHGPAYLRALARGVAAQSAAGAGSEGGKFPSLQFSAWLFPRGLVFTTLVLFHGLRRLLPPR